MRCGITSSASTPRLRLTGRESGIEVDRVWVYLFTVRDGKLLRQDGFDGREAAEQALAAGDSAQA